MSEAREVTTYSDKTLAVPAIEIFVDRDLSEYAYKRQFAALFRYYRENNFIHETDDYIYEFDTQLNRCIIHGLKRSPIAELIEIRNRRELIFDKFSKINREPFSKNADHIDQIVSDVSILNFDDIIIESSPNDSLIFKLSFSEKILLIINIPRESIGSESPLAVFTLLQNEETIVNSYNSLDNIVQGMQSYLSE